MKKFVLIHFGYETPTEKIMKDWNDWFTSIGDKIVDPGNPFGPGLEITHDGTKKLPHDKEAITGYTIINAENIEEAEKIAKSCPSITSIRVYEAMSM